MTSTRQQLDALLCERPASARRREQSAFDEIAAGRRKVVIFGAGRLGRKILQGLSGTGLEAMAFADNNRRLWGKVADGLPVVSPQDAADQYSSEATFVIAIWHPSCQPLMATLLTQLRGLRCRAAAFPVLFWRHPSTFLPYFFWDLPSNLLNQNDDIATAFDLLSDEVSQEVFVEQIQLRLRADFERIGAPASGEQYFPGLFSLSGDECFVDCGAYTGDTIQSLLAHTNNSVRRVIAFEADPAVLPGLETFMNDVGRRAVLHKAVVGSHKGVVSFAGDGIGGGSITANGDARVPCVRLDDALAGEHVSFIKMDIEGAELQALEGAHRIIWRDRPVLAVCGYHTPDHLWRVPLSLRKLAPDSALFLRAHRADGFDTVWYSVPPERQLQIASRSSLAMAGKKNSLARAQGSAS
jgi:FkbM family methyltransferase